MKANIRILLVEDEIVLALLLKKEILNIGYIIEKHVASGEKAIQSVLADPPDCIFMDIGLPGKIDGIDAMKEIKMKVDLPVIFITGYQDTKTRNRAMLENPLGYLVKPIDIQALKILLDSNFS